MNEVWKIIPGYDAQYKISNLGRIRGLKILKIFYGKDGYGHVHLCRHGRVKGFLVHRLVLTVFLRPPIEGEQAMHLDNNKRNNYLDNLKWGSQSENMRHSYATGIMRAPVGHLSVRSKLTKDEACAVRSLYDTGMFTMKGIAKLFNVAYTTVNYIVNGKTYYDY